MGAVRSAGARETALLPKAQRRGEPPAGRQAGLKIRKITARSTEAAGKENKKVGAAEAHGV